MTPTAPQLELALAQSLFEKDELQEQLKSRVWMIPTPWVSHTHPLGVAWKSVTYFLALIGFSIFDSLALVLFVCFWTYCWLRSNVFVA